MLDLMQQALETLKRVHRSMRTEANQSIAITRITSRADELLGIQHALAELLATGHVDIRQVDAGEDGNQPVQILAHMVPPVTHYGWLAQHLRAAGLVCHTPSIWKHPSGWLFLAHWADPAHSHRVITPDEVPA